MLSNSGDSDQMSRPAGSDLDRHCLPVSHKKDAWLIWVKERKAIRLVGCYWVGKRGKPCANAIYMNTKCDKLQLSTPLGAKGITLNLFSWNVDFKLTYISIASNLCHTDQ